MCVIQILHFRKSESHFTHSSLNLKLDFLDCQTGPPLCFGGLLETPLSPSLPARWLSPVLVLLVVVISLRAPCSFLRHFLRTTTAIARKKTTGDELGALAKANSYQGGAHRDRDGLRHCNKHVDKVKKDQYAASDGYVL
jgi:hypothetical protein